MTFSYSGDPSESMLDAVRFYAQDTNEADPLITDEEISFIIDHWSVVNDNPIYIAAVVCDTIAAKFAREIAFSADGVSLGLSELQNKYTELADSLRSQYTAHEIGGGPTVGGLLAGERFDPSIKPLIWSKGMHDNREAGRQEFGGHNTYSDTIPEIDGTY